MSSASLAGAIKVLIEAGGLGLTAVRDDWDNGTPTAAKYVTIDEAISVTTERLGDTGFDDPVTELVQVNLWQPWKAVGAGPAEDYSLANSLHKILHGSRPNGPTLVRSCTVDSVVRLLERDSNVVHHAFTLRIRRER